MYIIFSLKTLDLFWGYDILIVGGGQGPIERGPVVKTLSAQCSVRRPHHLTATRSCPGSVRVFGADDGRGQPPPQPAGLPSGRVLQAGHFVHLPAKWPLSIRPLSQKSW